MSTPVFLLLILSIGFQAPPEHLEPLPIHNGEISSLENWGWYHPPSKGGGILKYEGSARGFNLARDGGYESEYFDGFVVALDAGAAAITEIEEGNGISILLEAGNSYEIAWSQGALAVDPPPAVAVFILDKTLEEIPGTRVVRASTTTGADGWSRRSARITFPSGFNVEHGQMIAFQNVAESNDPTKSIALLDKVSIARIDTDGEGFTSLFDGRSLDGWVGAVKGYKAVNNVIELDLDSNAWGNLYTEGTYGDFILRFDFKLTPGANNGIGIRAPLGGDAAYKGMEVQVLENSHRKYSGLKPWQFHGSIYGIAPAERGYQRPIGAWNTEEIFVKGRRVRVTLNGKVITDVNLDEATKDGTLSGKKHPGLARTAGHIALCSHGDEVSFRNLRIKRLDATDQPESE